jgi:uncharacterized protein
MAFLIEALRAFFATDRMAKFAYLFGSHAIGRTTPLSDVDVAVYPDKRVNAFEYRLSRMEALSRIVKTDRVDVVLLNDAPPLLKYEIIRNGVVIKENRSRRVIFEALILQEYLDTNYLRAVQHDHIRSQLRRGTYFG